MENASVLPATLQAVWESVSTFFHYWAFSCNYTYNRHCNSLRSACCMDCRKGSGQAKDFSKSAVLVDAKQQTNTDNKSVSGLSLLRTRFYFL